MNYFITILILFLSFSCDKQMEKVVSWWRPDHPKSIHYLVGEGVNQEIVGRINYYRNGEISKIENYKNDNLHGAYKEFYDNGKRKIHGKFVHGLKTGIWKEWNEVGLLNGECNFIEGNCKWKSLYENGALKYEGSYINNLMNGLWIYYFDNGDTLGYGHFYNGNGTGINPNSGVPENGRDLTWIFYHENGQISGMYNFEKGVMNGIFNSWYPNSQLLSNGIYKNDKYDGILSAYSENGKMLSEVQYSSGKNNGIEKLWYENGNRKSDGFYKINTKHGQFVSWYENGQMKECGEYIDGRKDGWWNYWYSDGSRDRDG